MKHKINNSCGNGNGSCGSKDLFTLPYCGGRKVGPRRLRTMARRKANKPWKMSLLVPAGTADGLDMKAIFAQYMPL